MEYHLPRGGEEAATGDFFYSETLRQTEEKGKLWEGRKRL